HSVLFEARAEMHTVYFPLDAVVSLVVPLSTGITIETAMVGRDGVVGASAAINGGIALNRGFVRLSGHCLQCEARHLKAAVDESPAVRAQINAHEQALFGQ